MRTIKSVIRILIFVFLGIIAFGPPNLGQAAQETEEFSCDNVDEIPQLECEALVALYNSADGLNWLLSGGANYWLRTTTPCNWFGITCNTEHVTHIELAKGSIGNARVRPNPAGAPIMLGSLRGDVPTEIGNLSNLVLLDLSHNELSNIPSEISNLASLTSLQLNSNQLISLPANFARLTELATLDIGRNHLINVSTELQAFLDGKDPDWADTQTHFCTSVNEIPQIECEALVAFYNSTDGPNWFTSDSYAKGWLKTTTPCSWFGITCDAGHVTHIMLDAVNPIMVPMNRSVRPNPAGDSIRRGRLRGDVPEEIGNLPNLISLRLSTNQLSSIPPEIGNLINLAELDISHNQLSSIPSEIGNLANLTSLQISFNLLRGLPESFIKLSEMNNLDVSSNYLIDISAEQQIFLDEKDPDWTDSQNHFCNSVREISFIECEALVAFYDSTDGPNWSRATEWLKTTFPCSWDGIGCEEGQVTHVMLDGTSSTANARRPTPAGPIWTSYGLKGSIPAEIQNLSDLILLDLSYNNLSSLPAEIGNLNNLTTLDISSNQLSSLPTGITNLTGLNHLSLHNNHFINISDELRTFLDKKDPNWAYLQTDLYEPDNSCIEASSIEPTDRSLFYNFHNVDDTDWTTFIAPAAGTYRIEVTIPDNSHADIDLYYYTECDTFHEDKFVETFTAGASLDIEADSPGQQFYIKLKNYDPLQFGPNVSYALSVRQLTQEQDMEENPFAPGPAIVVAGRYRIGDSLQFNIDQTALAAYELLANTGRYDSDIFFLATDSSLPNFDGEATQRNLEYGITTWAKERLEKENVSQVLTLYLVDHGGADKFYLDRFKEEVLTSNDLHLWLSELEDAFPNLLVNVIIEACKAGSFIDQIDGSISKPGRVIITSSNKTYDAYASLYGARFSENFISFLGQEKNLGYSFYESSKIVQKFYKKQQPWIDADGNGIPNELSDISAASLRSIANWSFGAGWPPYIAQAQVMTDRAGGELRLQAEVRHEYDNSYIKKVWGVVYPPDYVHPTGDADYTDEGQLNGPELEIIEFTADASTNALFVSTEGTQFTQPGRYQVAIHAQDLNGLEARPIIVDIEISPTPTPTSTPTETPVPTSTYTPSLTSTPSATSTPTSTATPTATETLVPTSTPTPSPTPTPTNTPIPTQIPARVPEPMPTSHKIYMPMIQN